jgi:chromosome segregation ATPase
MAIKYEKEFVKPDGRRLPTGGPRDLQRRQRQESREQTELIDFLRVEIRDLNERLAVKTVGTGEYTGDQVDEEIRKAVLSAVEEVKEVTKEEMLELRSAADALKKNENNLLEQVKNLEVYQVGIQKELTDTKRLLEESKSKRSMGKNELEAMRSRRSVAKSETQSVQIEVAALNKKLNETVIKYSALEQELINVENQRVSLANELLEVKTGGDPDELYRSRKKREELQIELGELSKEKTKFADKTAKKEAEFAEEKNGLNALHSKDMKKFQAEIEFLIKEKTDLTNKHNKEITKFKLEVEKRKGEFNSLKEKAKQKGVDEEITTLLKEQTKQIEALTEALANAEQQLEIETNRPKMETAFIDPLEKGAGADLTPHIEIKEEKSGGEKGEIDDKVARLRSLMGKLPKANG